MILNRATKILDEDKFIKSHQLRIRSGGIPKVIDPFRDRLNEYAKIKMVHICSNCGELLSDDIWKCPNCGVNSQP